jgi:hypothetical protein
MLPENVALRERHAPLSEFAKCTCSTPLLFTPGSDCRYQSMGTVAWADPEAGLSCVILTNQPKASRLLSLVSNAVAATVEK